MVVLSCDIIERPRKNLVNLASATDHVVLLEEFTGHYCGNCPLAHGEADKLSEYFDSNLAIISIHSGYFAEPVHGPQFGTDYRTPAGNELDLFFDPSTPGYPTGMINRRNFGSGILQDFIEWGAFVQQAVDETPEMRIDIVNAYDTITRNLVITVDLEYFASASANDRLIVCFTEDSIVSPQKTNDSVIPDYVHRHVLRSTITNGTWGEVIDGMEISAGEQYVFHFNCPIRPEWNDKHCAIVAYVADDATKEIRQAAKEEVR